MSASWTTARETLDALAGILGVARAGGAYRDDELLDAAKALVRERKEARATAAEIAAFLFADGPGHVAAAALAAATRERDDARTTAADIAAFHAGDGPDKVAAAALDADRAAKEEALGALAAAPHAESCEVSACARALATGGTIVWAATWPRCDCHLSRLPARAQAMRAVVEAARRIKHDCCEPERALRAAVRRLEENA